MKTQTIALIGGGLHAAPWETLEEAVRAGLTVEWHALAIFQGHRQPLEDLFARSSDVIVCLGTQRADRARAKLAKHLGRLHGTRVRVVPSLHREQVGPLLQSLVPSVPPVPPPSTTDVRSSAPWPVASSLCACG